MSDLIRIMYSVFIFLFLVVGIGVLLGLVAYSVGTFFKWLKSESSE